MRHEMIGAIVRRAIEHPEFCKRLVEDPEDALSAHGFALQAAEFAEIERILGSLQGSAGEEAEQKLITIAERYGVHPPK